MDMAGGLLKALGVDPDELKQVAVKWAGEVEGFKTGFRAATAHFSGQLDLISRNQEIILNQQEEILRLLKPQEQTSVEIISLEDRRRSAQGADT